MADQAQDPKMAAAVEEALAGRRRREQMAPTTGEPMAARADKAILLLAALAVQQPQALVMLASQERKLAAGLGLVAAGPGAAAEPALKMAAPAATTGPAVAGEMLELVLWVMAAPAKTALSLFPIRIEARPCL
jgi:hypothetical protein